MTTPEVDNEHYASDVNLVDEATKRILRVLRASASHRRSGPIELGEILWEQANKHFVNHGGASPTPVRLEGTERRTQHTPSAWKVVLPDFYDSTGTVLRDCHKTLRSTSETLQDLHRSPDFDVVVGVDLVPPNPFLWEERWRAQILFRWFIEKKKDGSLVDKTYIVESRLIIEMMA